jgi:hypothetical protein
MTPDVVPFINGLSSESLLLLSLALVAGLLIGAFWLTLFWKRFLHSEVITFSRRKSRSRGTALLLVGPSDAGKTALLSTVCGLPRNSHRLFISESFYLARIYWNATIAHVTASQYFYYASPTRGHRGSYRHPWASSN